MIRHLVMWRLTTDDPAERARIEGEVADHIAQHPSPATDGSIEMPYVTHAFRSVRGA